MLQRRQPADTLPLFGCAEMHTTPGIGAPDPEPEPEPEAAAGGGDSEEELEDIVKVAKLLRLCMERRPQDMPTPDKLRCPLPCWIRPASSARRLTAVLARITGTRCRIRRVARRDRRSRAARRCTTFVKIRTVPVP